MTTNYQRIAQLRQTVVMQLFARLRMNLGNLRTSQNICLYVRMTDNNDILPKYGQRDNFVEQLLLTITRRQAQSSFGFQLASGEVAYLYF